MLFRAVLVAALCSVALSAADAKEPAQADQAALQRIIERIYSAYTIPVVSHESRRTEGTAHRPGAAMDGYRPALTPRLEDSLDRWWAAMKNADQIYAMNGFDWYCQCQDSDNVTARLVSQRYWEVSKNRVDVIVHFSPGTYEGKDTGSPLIFRFRRQGREWKLDDLKFHDFTTLRKGLTDDIRDVAKDMASEKPG
jgi:hypothetical protein